VTFTAPLGLLALLAVPAVLILHLFRRRLQERRVAGLFLFAGERLIADAGRRRTRILRSASLWCELLAAALAALWLAGPSCSRRPACHVVVVLDDSASMAAVHDGASAAARAAARLRELVAGLGSGDRVTLLRSAAWPELLLGPRALPAEVDAALARWLPAQPAHLLEPSLDFARELAGAGGQVIVCTDRETSPRDDATIVACGVALPNAAILTAQRFTVPDGEQIRATVRSFGGPLATKLVLRDPAAPGTALAEQALQLGPEPEHLVFALPAGTGAVHLELGADALLLDNTALLLPELPRTVAVCDVLPAAARQEFAIARVFAALPDWRAEADPQQAQLVLASGPGRIAPGQTEVVITPGEGSERDAWLGPFVTDQSHPVMQGIGLQGVLWHAGRAELPGRPLVTIGNRTLLAEETEGRARRFRVLLDGAAGNLPRAPDWPLWFANVLDLCRAEVPGPERSNLLLGDEARWRRSMVAGAADGSAELVAPDGSRQPGRGLRTLGFRPTQPGLHRVVGEGGRELGRFAVRFFDPSESDLSGARTFERAAAAAAGAASPLRDESLERRVLAVLLLCLVALDWWVLAGRRA
jgi:hypothetical protein